MANSKKVSQEHKKAIVWILGIALLVAIVAVVISINNSSDRSESDSDLNVTYSTNTPEEANSTPDPAPDTSSPTYSYDLLEEGMSEDKVDSILSDYKKNVSTEATLDGEHSKFVTYTGDLPNDSFIVITVHFTNGSVSYKTNYTGENPKATPYDSITTGMSEGEVDKLLSTYHKYEMSNSSYGGQTAKTVRYTDSSSTFVITYMNGTVSAKAR